MAHSGARKLTLRHPAENPTFALVVILNFVILAVLIGPAHAGDQAPRSQEIR